MNAKREAVRGAKFVARTALAAATLTAGKFVLSAIPNVEIVTLLCAVYGFVLGASGVLATLVFVSCESLLYGVGTWLISYFIHWPSVALVFWLLSRFCKPSRIVPTLIATVMTVWFGVLTSLVDIGLFSGYWDDFGARFAIYYSRGAVFYIVQIVCNAILFPLLFKPLCLTLDRLLHRSAQNSHSARHLQRPDHAPDSDAHCADSTRCEAQTAHTDGTSAAKQSVSLTQTPGLGTLSSNCDNSAPPVLSEQDGISEQNNDRARSRLLDTFSDSAASDLAERGNGAEQNVGAKGGIRPDDVGSRTDNTR